MAGPTPPRVGVVGLGTIGRFHAERLRETPGRLVGGVDVAPPARETFSDRFGVPTFSDLDGLFDHGVEAVIVTTPNSYHEDHAVAALDRDLPVLVEKPLAHTAESARRIVDAAGASAAFCMVGFHKRFLPGTQALTARIDRGEFGDIHHVEANYVRRRGIPGRGGWFTRQAVSGGGALVDIGTHVLDLALLATGFPAVESVSAAIMSEFGSRHDYTYLDMHGQDRGPDRFEVEDSVRGFLRTDSGASVSLNVAWAANEPDDTTITVVGADGGACLDHESGELELYTVADHTEPQLLTTGVATRAADAHREEQVAFLEGVATGDPPAANTVREGYAVQRVVDALYTAGETGDRISPGEVVSPGAPAD